MGVEAGATTPSRVSRSGCAGCDEEAAASENMPSNLFACAARSAGLSCCVYTGGVGTIATMGGVGATIGGATTVGATMPGGGPKELRASMPGGGALICGIRGDSVGAPN